MKKFLSIIFVALFALILVSCGGPKPTAKTTITISGSSVLKVGDTKTYKAKFKPESAAAEVTWISSDPSILKIDEKTGEVEALGVSETGVWITAKTKDGKVEGKKKIRVKDASAGVVEEYPDLGGYTIKIAQAEQELREFDPFLEGYTQADKEYKQAAWNEVQEDFNCTIQVVPFPDYAPWGPSRWQYIEDQAEHTTADFDFYTVPDMEIPGFVDSGCLVDLTNFYIQYGDERMDPTLKTSGSYKGRLYSLMPYSGSNNVYNVMYYNIGLFEQLKEQDPELKEPAQIFLDGDWTYTGFEDFCQKADAAMMKKWQARSKENEEENHYVISGWPTYWFVGFCSNDGVPMANTRTMEINLQTEHCMKAAKLIQDVCYAEYSDHTFQVDQSVASWNAGRSLFNTGDLWFVKNDGRWKKDLWGQGQTRYGYVPWPRPDDLDKDSYKIGLGGSATWVMPKYRKYSDYGDECNEENIYRAVMEMLKRSDEKYKTSSSYDPNLALQKMAERYADSEASQKAFKVVQGYLEAGKGYYDPLISNDNPIGSLYTKDKNENPTTIRHAVEAYADGTFTTWAEAIASVEPVLKEAMVRAYS